VLTIQFRAQFTVRHGEIQAATITGLEYHYAVDDASQDVILSNALVKERLHHIQDWRSTLQQASPVPVDVDGVGEWLNHMFGIEASINQDGGAVSDAVVQMISGTSIGKFLNNGNTDL
jgi:lipoate-protein ligase A